MKWSVLIFLILVEASGVLGLGIWREYFWAAVSDKQVFLFWKLLGVFSVIALLLCVLSGVIGYMSTMMALRTRKSLTLRAFGTKYHSIEGGNQRVQEDCLMYPTLLNTLMIAALRNGLGILIAVYLILMALPWYYIVIPISYAMVSTGLAAVIAKPLINLNYLNQVAEAAFRASPNWLTYYRTIVVNSFMAVKTKHLSYFQSFYAQITVIVPLIILAPSYFGAIISFGILMQQAAAMRDMIDGMGYFVGSFDTINKFLSCKKRLKELEVI